MTFRISTTGCAADLASDFCSAALPRSAAIPTLRFPPLSAPLFFPSETLKGHVRAGPLVEPRDRALGSRDVADMPLSCKGSEVCRSQSWQFARTLCPPGLSPLCTHFHDPWWWRPRLASSSQFVPNPAQTASPQLTRAYLFRFRPTRSLDAMGQRDGNY